MIKCPNDGKAMKVVKTLSHYGVSIELDQCEECGGLWFDNTELYRIRHGASKKIDKLNEKKLKKSLPIQKGLLCPRDKKKLIVFKDPNFPKEIQVERCRECGGFWFNRGEMISFQEWRKMYIEDRRPKERIISEKDKKFETQIEKLLAMGSSGAAWDTVGSVGRFLSTPVRRSGRGVYIDRPGNRRNAGKADMAFSIIRLLLRMFIR